MNMIVDILNIFIVILYAATVLHMYNRYTDYFVSMLIILIYWAQLLVSSSYIETGVYLKDIGKYSYATGVTFRIFLMIEILMFTIMFFANKWEKKVSSTSEDIESTYDCTKWNIALIIMYGYRFIDIMISGNVLTDPDVTRFNYFSDYSSLPLAQVIDYFSYPMLYVAGYNLIHAESRKQKAIPIIVFMINIISLLLRGIQFGGFMQCTIYFLSPALLKLAKYRKLLRFRYIALAMVLLMSMLIPKYKHFSEFAGTNSENASYGLNTAYDMLMYRMFAQEADLTWEIDREVVEDNNIDPEQYLYEIASIFGISTEKELGAHYLMNRGCSLKAIEIYNRGSALVTGGYPIIYPAMFGYLFAWPFLLVDGFLISVLCRCICQSLKERRIYTLIMATYIFCQLYTIIQSSNFSTLGNLIPRFFILILILSGMIKNRDKSKTYSIK